MSPGKSEIITFKNKNRNKKNSNWASMKTCNQNSSVQNTVDVPPISKCEIKWVLDEIKNYKELGPDDIYNIWIH